MSKSLKPTRDPYFNPRRQADSGATPSFAPKFVGNPAYSLKPLAVDQPAASSQTSAQPHEPTQSGAIQPRAIHSEPSSRSNLVWQPPVKSSPPGTTTTHSLSSLSSTPGMEGSIIRMSSGANGANGANSVPPLSSQQIVEPARVSQGMLAQPGNHQPKGNGLSPVLPTNQPSLTRAEGLSDNTSREIVGNFSADLSQLRKPVGDPLLTMAAPDQAQSLSRSAGQLNPSSDFLSSDFSSSDSSSSDFSSSDFSTSTLSSANGLKQDDHSIIESAVLSRETLVSTDKPQGSGGQTPSMIEPTRLLAMVGNEPIFVGDMLFELNQMIEKHLPTAPESVKERERHNGITMLLSKYIDSKLLYVDTLSKMPENADLNKILDSASKEFDKTAAPVMMKAAGIDSLTDFDAYLRLHGSSLRKMRLTWSKDQITRYFLSQELDVDTDVTHRELIEEYQLRKAEWAIPAKARWEQITVRFDRCDSRAQAEQLLVEMGNKIVYGANFGSVAKKGSHGFTAANGGLHDWTAKGELASKELDEALFSEPIGRLSEKITTNEGIHIIRVLERTEATHIPFVEAQVEIKQQLQDKKRGLAFEKHVERIREEIPVVRFEADGSTAKGASQQ